jgi:hypothetical protein
VKVAKAISIVQPFSPGVIKAARDRPNPATFARRQASWHLKLYDAWITLAIWFEGGERVCRCGGPIGDKWDPYCLSCERYLQEGKENQYHSGGLVDEVDDGY